MQHGSQLQCTFRYLIGVVCCLHGQMEMEELDAWMGSVLQGVRCRRCVAVWSVVGVGACVGSGRAVRAEAGSAWLAGGEKY